MIRKTAAIWAGKATGALSRVSRRGGGTTLPGDVARMIDPKVLIDELDALRARRVDVGGLRISANAHLIMPYHLLLDSAGEAKLGSLQIGTTRRGIGPCYADKAARLGIRVQDLLDEKILKKKIVAAMEPKRLSLRPFEKDPTLDLHTMTEEYLNFGHRLEQHIADTSKLLWEMLDAGKKVILEGAQGAMLDIDATGLGICAAADGAPRAAPPAPPLFFERLSSFDAPALFSAGSSSRKPSTDSATPPCGAAEGGGAGAAGGVGCGVVMSVLWS